MDALGKLFSIHLCQKDGFEIFLSILLHERLYEARFKMIALDNVIVPILISQMVIMSIAANVALGLFFENADDFLWR